VTGPLPAALAAVLAIVVMAGAVTAVAAREQRLAVLGLMIALAGAPFLGDPLPDVRGMVARIAGAALVAYVLLMAVRAGPAAATRAAVPASPAAMSWPVAAVAALAATLIVVAASDAATVLSDGVAARPSLPAAAAGAALLVVAAAPVAVAADPLRLTIGLLLAVAAAALLGASVNGPATALAELCVAVLLGVLATAGSHLARVTQSIRAPGRQ
jgi:hypothetical protein